MYVLYPILAIAVGVISTTYGFVRYLEFEIWKRVLTMKLKIQLLAEAVAVPRDRMRRVEISAGYTRHES